MTDTDTHDFINTCSSFNLFWSHTNTVTPSGHTLVLQLPTAAAALCGSSLSTILRSSTAIWKLPMCLWTVARRSRAEDKDINANWCYCSQLHCRVRDVCEDSIVSKHHISVLYLIKCYIKGKSPFILPGSSSSTLWQSLMALCQCLRLISAWALLLYAATVDIMERLL